MSDDDLIKRGDALDLRDKLADIIGARPMSSIHSALCEYRNAIAALPAVSAPVAVRVKPLVWEDVSDQDGGHWRSSTVFSDCQYYLLAYPDGTWSWSTNFRTNLGYAGCQGKGLTLEAAKVAAQANYAARIMAAIDAPDVTELMRERDDFESEWGKALALAEQSAALMSEMDDRRITAEAKVKELVEALRKAHEALLWCARDGRMASPSLHQYPAKWADEADAALARIGGQ